MWVGAAEAKVWSAAVAKLCEARKKSLAFSNIIVPKVSIPSVVDWA
jgi:hypothetical protein